MSSSPRRPECGVGRGGEEKLAEWVAQNRRYKRKCQLVKILQRDGWREPTTRERFRKIAISTAKNKDQFRDKARYTRRKIRVARDNSSQTKCSRKWG